MVPAELELVLPEDLAVTHEEHPGHGADIALGAAWSIPFQRRFRRGPDDPGAEQLVEAALMEPKGPVELFFMIGDGTRLWPVMIQDLLPLLCTCQMEEEHLGKALVLFGGHPQIPDDLAAENSAEVPQEDQ